MLREAYSYRNDPALSGFPDDKPIIIFDGYCALCTGWAAFVLRHDKRHRYRLLTAQSELGKGLYIHYGLDPEDYETNILIEDGIAWFKSEGSIRMAVGLGWPWRAAGIFRNCRRACGTGCMTVSRGIDCGGSESATPATYRLRRTRIVS